MIAVSRARTVRGVASVVTEVFAPPPVVAAVLLVVALARGDGSSRILQAGIAVMFGVVAPFTFVIYGVRTHRWSDHHVPDRQQRLLPIAVAMVSMVVGALALAAARTPPELFGVYISGFALLVGLGLVTRLWKISAHMAVFTGAVIISAGVFGSRLLIGFALLPILAWSRLALAAHTPWQVFAGACLGGAVAAACLPLVR